MIEEKLVSFSIPDQATYYDSLTVRLEFVRYEFLKTKKFGVVLSTRTLILKDVRVSTEKPKSWITILADVLWYTASTVAIVAILMTKMSAC